MMEIRLSKCLKMFGVFLKMERENLWGTDLLGRLPAVLSRIDAKPLPVKKVNVTEVFKTDKMLLGIAEDNEGNIWIGGGDGVYLYIGDTFTYCTGIQGSGL